MSTFEKIRKAALARLDAGEPAHIILQDYADYEDELRPLLEKATGQPVSAFSAGKAKIKAKNTKQASMLPLVLAAIIVLVIGFGAAIFFFIPVSSDAITAQPVQDTTCVGIPQPQITSRFALQDQNQQQVTRSEDVIYESGEIVVEGMSTTGSGGGGETLPDTGGGPGSATSDLYLETTMSTGIEVDEAAPLSTSPPTLIMSDDDAVDMDMAEEAPPVDIIESESRSGADTTMAYAPDPAVARNNISSEPLRAGEIDDNAEWDDYQDYRNEFLDDYGTFGVRDVDTTGRQVIRVIDSDGNPVLNACVEIFNGDTHITSTLTYATGMTMFFPNLNKDTRYVDTFRVVASKGETVTETTLDRDVVGAVTTIELPISQQYERVQLDVMFLLDATGSMGDEIAQLQGNILAISEQIDALPGNIDVRYGLVTYLDRGDVYVTRVHEFTDSVSEFQEDLIAVVAQGGGDYPESMNEGLDMALNAVDWRSDDTVRLMFLVADAPPHVDYQDDADYSLLMQDALARGIKIHQIASGGLQPEGEFVMRQIAQFTMGRFLFLTYDEGVVGTVGDDRPDLEVGVPEDEQGIGDYSVSQLDELVLRLITDEIESLRGE